MTTGSMAAGGSRTVFVAGGFAALGTLPAFLAGSLASFMREDFPLSRSQLGLAVAGFFVSSAVATLPGGRVAEGFGARRSLLGAAALSGAATLGIGATAFSAQALFGWLIIAGLANGFVQPAGNLAIARNVSLDRLGMAFGIKQSAIPTATLIAGAAVPVLGLTVGWRWAFGGVAIVAVLLAWNVPPDQGTSRRVARPGVRLREGDMPLLPMVMLSFATGCGAAVATSLASFYVDSAADSGVSLGRAGALLSAASLSVIIVRVLIGWYSDRTHWNHLKLVGRFLAVGSLGFIGLSMSEHTFALLAGTLLSFVAGWGWPGLFNMAIVRLNNNAPAMATSITQLGVFVGGTLGPAAFGLIAERASFRAAWWMAACLCLVAAGATRLAVHVLEVGKLPA